MDRVPVAVVLLITLFSKGHCQEAEMEIVIRPALTSLYGNPAVRERFDPALHFSTAIGMNVFISPNALVNIDLLYERKGAEGTITFMGWDANNVPTKEMTSTSVVDYEYISLPVLYKKRFGKMIKVQAGAGFYTSYLVRYVQTEKTELSYVRSENKDAYKVFDFGVAASIETYIPLVKRVSLLIGLEDYLGLLNVSRVPVIDDGSIKHNSLGGVFGLNYSLK